MSIWGKVIGGVAGFAIGGPLGAILGAVAGHTYDKSKAHEATGYDALASRQAAFTIAVIVLSAKMAKADGVVTREEIDAFKQIFHIPPNEMQEVGRLFDQAKDDAKGFELYAEQVGRMFAHEPAVLEELLGGLFHIAKADGVVHPAELDYLKKVAAIFGFDAHGFERIRAGFMGPDEVWRWWDARSRATIRGATQSDGRVRFEAVCEYRDGFVVKAPTGSTPAADCVVDGASATFENAWEFGQHWAFVPLAPGEHVVELGLQPCGPAANAAGSPA